MNVGADARARALASEPTCRSHVHTVFFFIIQHNENNNTTQYIYRSSNKWTKVCAKCAMSARNKITAHTFNRLSMFFSSSCALLFRVFALCVCA